MPRAIEARLKAMRALRPPRRGLCAWATWQACGGSGAGLDYLPPLGAVSATVATNKIANAGHLRGTTKLPNDAPRGAILCWRGGSQGYGHLALSLGWVDGIHRCLTVDALGLPMADVPTLWIDRNWGNLRYAGWSTWYGMELPPAYPGSPVVRGDSGKPVKEIQRRLGVRQTGLFGELTEAAVNKHIRARPWLGKADGVVGPKTYASILARKKPL